MGKVAKKVVPKKRPPQPKKEYRVMLTRYLSSHATQAEASKAMKKFKGEKDDLLVVLEVMI